MAAHGKDAPYRADPVHGVYEVIRALETAHRNGELPDSPEGTVIVRMSHTLCDQMATTLRREMQRLLAGEPGPLNRVRVNFQREVDDLAAGGL